MLVALSNEWLTRRADKVREQEGKAQLIVWDDGENSFFGCRIGARKKTFICRANNPSGKRETHTIGDFPEWTTGDARKRAKTIVRDIKEGKQIVTGNTKSMTLATALDKWDAEKKPSDYRYRCEKYLADWLTVPLAAITLEMVDVKFKLLTKTGKHTANTAIKRFGTIYKNVKIRESLPESPVELWKQAGNKFHVMKRRKHPRTMKRDLPMIWEAILSYPNATLSHWAQLIALSGCRPLQALALRWENVDFNFREITFVEGNKNNESHGDEADEEFTIPMTDEVRAILIRQKEQVALMDFKDTRSEYVFPARDVRKHEKGHLTEYKTLIDAISDGLKYRLQAYDFRRWMISRAAHIDGITSDQARLLTCHASNGADAHEGYISADVEELMRPLQVFEDDFLSLVKTDIRSRRAA